MDYKYIEQLLERYWECQTTLEEEAILRQFFAQSDVPASLLPYRDIFRAEEQMKAEARLGDDFDRRVLAAIGARPDAQARTSGISLSARLAPLYRAAATVAMVLSLGMAAQHGLGNHQQQEGVTDGVALQPGDSTTMEILPATTAESAQSADSLSGSLTQ